MKDHVRYRRVPALPGLVLGEARFAEFRFAPHYHLDYHIGVIPVGAQRQRFNGASQVLAPGRVSIMPPGEIHDGVGVDGQGYVLHTFRVPASLLDGVHQEITGSASAVGWPGAVVEDAGLSRHLLGLHRRMPDGSPLCLEEHWLQLVPRLLRHAGHLRPQQVDGGLADVHWQRVREYCHAYLAEPLTLQQLAGLCGLDRFQFLRRFKHTVGMTPHAWLVRLRLEKACGLLADGRNRLVDVAQAVGFYDQSHFNRAFRQAYGVAPSAY